MVYLVIDLQQLKLALFVSNHTHRQYWICTTDYGTHGKQKQHQTPNITSSQSKNASAYGVYNYLWCKICLYRSNIAWNPLKSCLRCEYQDGECVFFFCLLLCQVCRSARAHQKWEYGMWTEWWTLWMPQINAQDQKLTMKLLYNVTNWRNRNGECHEEKFVVSFAVAAAMNQLHTRHTRCLRKSQLKQCDVEALFHRVSSVQLNLVQCACECKKLEWAISFALGCESRYTTKRLTKSAEIDIEKVQ